MGEFTYDYAAAQAYCESLGMVWRPDWLSVTDAHFARDGLTQAQVDGCLRLYCWNVKYLFTPTNYTLRQRLALAWHFVFGGRG